MDVNNKHETAQEEPLCAPLKSSKNILTCVSRSTTVRKPAGDVLKKVRFYRQNPSRGRRRASRGIQRICARTSSRLQLSTTTRGQETKMQQVVCCCKTLSPATTSLEGTHLKPFIFALAAHIKLVFLPIVC